MPSARIFGVGFLLCQMNSIRRLHNTIVSLSTIEVLPVTIDVVPKTPTIEFDASVVVLVNPHASNVMSISAFLLPLLCFTTTLVVQKKRNKPIVASC